MMWRSAADWYGACFGLWASCGDLEVQPCKKTNTSIELVVRWVSMIKSLQSYIILIIQ